ncbi:hypothetical protein VDGD_21659 [Verticillium dahliae]|nr:hypothetical protein VDGD_21659 [Verticillium dahliae]
MRDPIIHISGWELQAAQLHHHQTASTLCCTLNGRTSTIPPTSDNNNNNNPRINTYTLCCTHTPHTYRTTDTSLAMAQGDSARVQEAQKLAKSNPREAEQAYQEILSKPPSATSDAAIKEYEAALISLGELYRDEKNAQSLVDLVTTSRTTLSSFAKAKTAKLGEMTSLNTPPPP